MARNTVGKKVLRDMIFHRSSGRTISETAFRLGIRPWTVSYWTRFIKMCVSTEELMWLEEEANIHKFGTVGEFVMDVFNKTYEQYYNNNKKSRLKKVS